jgi:hypothetical protein
MKNTNKSLNVCLSGFSYLRGVLYKAEINTTGCVYCSNDGYIHNWLRIYRCLAQLKHTIPTILNEVTNLDTWSFCKIY